MKAFCGAFDERERSLKTFMAIFKVRPGSDKGGLNLKAAHRVRGRLQHPKKKKFAFTIEKLQASAVGE